MARHTVVVESAAALAADTNFANLVAGTVTPLKLRRVILGVRAGASAPTSQQITVALIRATARGSPTTTVAPRTQKGIGRVAESPGVDTVWSTGPTLVGTTPALSEARISFNSQSGADIPFEGPEEFEVQPAASNANGLVFRNVGNALPASHLITLTVEFEE
jgi:hypothetical protein